MIQRIEVTLDQNTVTDLDRWVQEGRFASRSRALQSAVALLARRESKTRLVTELGKLDAAGEQQMAEEGIGDESWPQY